MYQYKGIEDTIAAISTSLGAGGIGIIRLSGSAALTIADDIFHSAKKNKPSQAKTFSVHYGHIVRREKVCENVLDEVLLTVMRAPRSYTCEDVVEISCHGGAVVQRMILELVLDKGARLAEPGEFTKRAFLNGRIDLTQAEAVNDVIHARTEAYVRVSHNQLQGDLSQRLNGIRAELMNIYTALEALVNFPEDDTQSKQNERLLEHLKVARGEIENILAASQHGRILREGFRLVLCGQPNVGKSSILNVLLKQQRAIVADVAGTTRDPIEESAQIQGIPFQLVDTAGIIEPRDYIEQEAVKRSQMHAQAADLVLLVLDGSQKLSEQDRVLMRQFGERNVIVILNKMDCGYCIEEEELRTFFVKAVMVKISALKGEGIDQLESAIVQNIWHGERVETNGIVMSNVRHITALKFGLDFILEAEQNLKVGISVEFVSESIKSAVNALDAITGRNIDADLVDTIFSQFCIGK